MAEDMGIDTNIYFRNCIYTGIATDTGCFRYQNTSALTFRIAAALMEKGIKSNMINKLMFETKSKSFLELEMLARETLEYHFDGKCAIITINQEMYDKSGADEHQCYPITALPRQIEGVLVGAVLKQKVDGSFGISVRTDEGIDASEICARLGGGGHKGAAGCHPDCSYEEAKKLILDSIKITLDGLGK
jgi:phosphoesterase RecJ-like protein